MAIADILLACGDKNRRGGIKRIFYQDITNVTSFTTGATDHEYTAVTMDSTGDLWFEIEGQIFEKELSWESSNENGSAVFENVLDVIIPKLEKAKAATLQSIVESCELVFIIETYNETTTPGNNIAIVMGFDELLGTDAGMRANVNGGSGRALQDPNAYTLNATGQSAEIPRIFSGTIELSQGGTGTFT